MQTVEQRLRSYEIFCFRQKLGQATTVDECLGVYANGWRMESIQRDALAKAVSLLGEWNDTLFHYLAHSETAKHCSRLKERAVPKLLLHIMDKIDCTDSDNLGYLVDGCSKISPWLASIVAHAVIDRASTLHQLTGLTACVPELKTDEVYLKRKAEMEEKEPKIDHRAPFITALDEAKTSDQYLTVYFSMSKIGWADVSDLREKSLTMAFDTCRNFEEYYVIYRVSAEDDNAQMRRKALAKIDEYFRSRLETSETPQECIASLQKDGRSAPSENPVQQEAWAKCDKLLQERGF